MLLGIFVKAFVDYRKPGAGLSPAVLGIGTPVVIGVGSLLLGVVAMVVWQVVNPAFFRRGLEVAGPAPVEDTTSAAPPPPVVPPPVAPA